MSILWSSSDAVRATGGRATRDWQAGGVSIDTRTIQPGDLFIALKDVRDGHDFVADALGKGAAAAMVSRIPDGVPEDAPLLVVEDVLAGLTDLGRAGRDRTSARVIAITGSAGKTSTKEMLRDTLQGQGRVHAAEASYNNHWGVPLTLARMAPETEFALIEIGMNHPGEIAPLTRLARPHIAIITTIAPAHLEAFDSIEGIAHEKASIFQGLEPEGIAIFNGDVPETGILRDTAKRHARHLIGFGTAETAEFRATAITATPTSSVVHARHAGRDMVFKVGAPGAHVALNALAVLAAAEAAGADPDIAAHDLGRWAPPAGRGTREKIYLDPVEDHLTMDLIDDAFNANPASVAASLDVFAAIQPVDNVGRVSRGRRIVILGDMLELGPDEARMHAEIADHPALREVAKVHCVGPRMAALWDALPEHRRGRRVGTAEELAREAHHLVDAGDVVLVKGSKGSKVSLVVEAIRKLGHPGPDET